LQYTDRFRLVEELEMNNPHLFFSAYAKGSWLVTTFFVLLAGGLGLIISLTFMEASSNHLAMLGQPAAAMAFVFIVLLPVHEGIHALAYKALGAKDIRFSCTWRKWAVYTCAHRFVIRRKEIIPLALAPFVVITFALLTLAGLLPIVRLFFLWSMWFHAALCGGDMILVAYALRNRGRALYNFDDVEAGKSYFYERTDP
jgi:fumarate reductase subunit D